MDRSQEFPPPPRKVRLKPTFIFGQVFLWTLAMILVVGGPALMQRSLDRLDSLRRTGRVVTARVVSQEVSESKNTSYYLTVTYHSGDQAATQKADVSSQIFINHPKGSTIPVTVSKTNPNDFEIGRIDDSTLSEDRETWLIGMAGVGAFIGILLLITGIEVRRDRKFLSRGIAALGTVYDVRVTRGRTASTQIRFRYSTQLGEREAKCAMNGAYPDRFKEGADTLVLYLPNNDRKVRPFAMITAVLLD